MSSAIGEINPFHADYDRQVTGVFDYGQRHGDLARALVQEPGIERWWTPLDRERQVWIEPESRTAFPSAGTFPTPQEPPTRFEIYAQHPHPWVSTSTQVDGWTSQLTGLVSGTGDWHVNYPARRAHMRVSPEARVLEIDSAEAWHAMAVACGTQSSPSQSPHPYNHVGLPWGPNDGLVPDWSAVARHRDGVHLTLWGYLTATQVRIDSDAGWTMAWSWEGEQTLWLRWAFKDVHEMPTLETLPEGRHYPLSSRLW